jgi:hypothetical protein
MLMRNHRFSYSFTFQLVILIDRITLNNAWFLCNIRIYKFGNFATIITAYQKFSLLEVVVQFFLCHLDSHLII